MIIANTDAVSYYSTVNGIEQEGKTNLIKHINDSKVELKNNNYVDPTDNIIKLKNCKYENRYYNVTINLKTGEVTIEINEEGEKEEEEIVEGAITINNPSWTEGKAQVIIKTEKTGYEFQYKVVEIGDDNLQDGWQTIEGNEINILVENNKVVRARLYNGVKAISHASLDIQDIDAPVITIGEFTPSSIKMGEETQIEVQITDAKSGVDLTKCKYIFSKQEEELGLNPDLYTEELNEANKTLTFSANELSTCYLHVLAQDNAGNQKEEISNAITISNKAPTVTASLASKTTNSITVSVTGQDNDGDNLTATLYTKTASGSYIASGTASIAGGSGTQSITASSLSNYTDYTYYVVLTDNIETVQTTEITVRTYCPGNGHTATYCSGTTESSSTCGNCGGKGSISTSCSSCGGRGKIWYCEYCGHITNGNEYICASCGRWPSWFSRDCSSCNGLGNYNSRCYKCSGTGKITINTPGCSHSYTSPHYYCTTHNYNGSVSEHCIHRKTAQHDD